MNKERVKEVALLVRDNGIKIFDDRKVGFNMGNWGHTTECSTTACIAGTCYIASDQYKKDFNDILNNKIDYKLSNCAIFYNMVEKNASEYASEYMELTDIQSYNLFQPDSLFVSRKWTYKEICDLYIAQENFELSSLLNKQKVWPTKKEQLSLNYSHITTEMAYICMMNLIETKRVNWGKAINQYFDENNAPLV